MPEPAARPPRSPPKSRGTRRRPANAFTGKTSDIIALMAAQIPEGSAAERRRKAIAIYATMVGALQLSRAVNDRQLSGEILENAAEAAVTLAGSR